MRVVALALCASACTGTLSIGTSQDSGPIDAFADRTDAGPGVDSGPLPDGSSPGDAGTETRVDAGPCGANGLAASLSVVPIAGVTARAGIYAAPSPGGGAVLAWTGAGGVHLTRVDGAGVAVGADVIVTGSEPWGVAMNADTLAVLVDRGSDALYLVGTAYDGSPRFEHRLLGEVAHDVTNNEWFGSLLRAGRLVWTGSQWAAYFTVQRLWPDGIAHYGDTLRLHAADGAAAATLWGWGCSHSLEVGLAHNGVGLGPLCMSDCFPDKGVFFDHTAQVFLDASGNCMGSIDSRLGGIAPVASGFWIAFASPAGRTSMDVGVAHVGNDRSVSVVRWLTSDGSTDSNVRVGRYGSDGALVAWSAGPTDRAAVIDASGAIAIGPEDLPGAGLAGASDLFQLADGDLAWVTSTGETSLVRVRVCP